jgi:hypothetical protein
MHLGRKLLRFFIMLATTIFFFKRAGRRSTRYIKKMGAQRGRGLKYKDTPQKHTPQKQDQAEKHKHTRLN